MEQKLLEEFWALGIEELKTVTGLHRLKGDYINLPCRLPGGQVIRILNDDGVYLGAEVYKAGSGRCYGLAGDAGMLAVYEYGNGGADAELVIYKRR